MSFLAEDATVLDSGDGTAANVEPGATANWTAGAFADGVEDVDHCDVASVTRTASM